MPFFRFPIHFSYALYIATFSAALAQSYFRSALTLCSLARTEPSLLLHPLDFLSDDDAPELAFFPAMRLGVTRKLSLLNSLFSLLDGRRRIIGMADHAGRLQHDTELAIFSPEGMNLGA